MSDSTTSLKTILAPIDFSDFSNNALDVAADLASFRVDDLQFVAGDRLAGAGGPMWWRINDWRSHAEPVPSGHPRCPLQ